MSYIDGYLIAVPTENKQAYIDFSLSSDSIFVDMGATRVVQCWGDDVSEGSVTDMRKAVQAKTGESIVFAWVEWPDKDTREAAMAKMMADDFEDDRLDSQKNPMPFDGSRLIYGGFQQIVEL